MLLQQSQSILPAEGFRKSLVDRFTAVLDAGVEAGEFVKLPDGRYR
jgi:hypothetical protein